LRYFLNRNMKILSPSVITILLALVMLSQSTKMSTKAAFERLSITEFEYLGKYPIHKGGVIELTAWKGNPTHGSEDKLNFTLLLLTQENYKKFSHRMDCASRKKLAKIETDLEISVNGDKLK